MTDKPLLHQRKSLRGGMRVVLYECTFCGDLDASSEQHVHSDREPTSTYYNSPYHRPKRRVHLLVQRTEKL